MIGLLPGRERQAVRSLPRVHRDVDDLHVADAARSQAPAAAVFGRQRSTSPRATIDLDSADGKIRVGGIGGCYGPSDYERRSKDLQSRAKRHFTRDEVERMCGRRGVDVLLLHDAPGGVEFTWRRADGSVRRRYQSEAEGLAQAVVGTRPRICFFGHHHTRVHTEVAGIQCIGLNKVAMPGNLVALDMPARGRGYEILGEWPRPE